MSPYEELYAAVSALPLIDWHNHLDVRVLAADAAFGSLYAVWVAADPYKHRAMRICGEPERLITGDAPESEKWAAWRRTLPKLVGNPLHAWARMELAFLGIDGCENVPLEEWTPSRLLRAFHVAYASPCLAASDAEGLAAVARLAASPAWKGCAIVPSLRLNAGEAVSSAQLEAFQAAGCRVVDVSVDDAVNLERQYAALEPVAAYAATHRWTMLLHLGALRETSARLRAVAGPAGGFAACRAPVDPAAVAVFLNRLEAADALPATVLLTLNPEAHAQLAVLAGSFVEEGIPGKVQLGPAWWWCDHREGIVDVLEKNAAYGVLSTFLGMTTDSRSLLSFVRHAYFRQLLCRWAAGRMAAGDFPSDPAEVLPVLKNVAYANAAARLGVK